ncbi:MULTISPECIES: hypothetical protein [unclassified Microbacterium]|uniref:hypothetical protein n=1 Tax=unclassified Microbacterium TaxID=2609290 RepID=UPI00300FBE4C
MTDAVETTEEVEADEFESDEQENVDADAIEEEDPTAGLRKALQAERKAHRDAERRAKAAEQALADKDRPAEEAALDAARREAREEAMSAANVRLVRAELKAAMAGKVTNPALALRLIDTTDIEVSADGDVDPESIDAAITALLDEAPELRTARFQGGADQGTKGKGAKPTQLTQADLKNMTPEQINEARRSGRLNKLLGATT